MTTTTPAHDRLLEAMDVEISAFAVLNLSLGYRLCFGGASAAIVHFVLSGRGLLEFPKGPDLPVAAGDIVILPPGGRKTIRVGEGPVSDIWLADRCQTSLAGLVQVDTSPEPPVLRILCGSIAPRVGGEHGLFDRLPHPIQENLQPYPLASAAFAQLRCEFDAPAFATHTLTGALMKACLSLVIRERFDDLFAIDAFADTRGDRDMRRAIGYIMDRPSAAHSLGSLSDIAGMSRTRFSQAFVASMGASPMAFVMQVRLHYARKLLLSTNLPVKAVAASVGLSRSYFSRAFRSAYEQDPLSFRKQERNMQH